MALQVDRLMEFTSPLGKDVLLIEGLTGAEGISHLFEFHADLLADVSTTIDPRDIVGKKVAVSIALTDSSGTRWVNGIVTSFEQGAGDDEYNEYRATIMPAMWELTLASNCRVFQNQTVLDVVKKIFTDYGLSISDQTKGTYAKLEYCTQYSESDFHFVSRLLQEHGISYWFEHSEQANKIILADDTNAYQDCPIVSEVQFEASESGSEGAYGSRVSEFTMEASMVSGSHSTADYNYRTYERLDVDPMQSASKYGDNSYDVYLYPAGEEGYLKDLQTQSVYKLEQTFLKSRFQASEAVVETYRGNGNTRTFTSGFTFTMTGHAVEKFNTKYLLVGVTHSVDQIPSYRTKQASSGDGYSNRFLAVPSTVVYKAPHTFVKPRIYGPQTAKVVVSQGEEIHLDKLGRINVQFFWDKVRKANDVDNTWVRVAQQWAGNGWGSYFWPRIGDEVIVEFLNGDPDNPVVVGSVYNGTNVPKYALPDMSTRSGWVTRSSKGGTADNANELRFEDKKGSEQIFVNAEKDMDHRVEADHRMYVGGKDSLIVMGNQLDQIAKDRNSNVKGNLIENVGSNADINIGSNLTEKVGGNSSTNVAGNLILKTGGNADVNYGGNLTEAIGGNSSQNVTGNRAEQVGINYSLGASMDAYMNAGMTFVIEAGMGITLSGPGGFITIGPAGVMISGTMVLINSGGAALSGSPGNVMSPQSPQDPKSPTDPDTADDGTKGGKMNS
jgi:type VI secretion system secreted protein VgrG